MRYEVALLTRWKTATRVVGPFLSAVEAARECSRRNRQEADLTVLRWYYSPLGKSRRGWRCKVEVLPHGSHLSGPHP